MSIPSLSGLNVYSIAGKAAVLSMAAANYTGRAFRPPQWASNRPSFTWLYNYNDGNGYYFDAVFKIDQSLQNRITEHPVQNGANISDHVYNLPHTVTLEIGMSDSMESYKAGQFTGGRTRSITAYNVLVNTWRDKDRVLVWTRYGGIENCVIERIDIQDDYKTARGLRATVAFRQIITVGLKTTKVSARPHAMQETKKGPVQTTTPNASILARAEEEMKGE
jgi:hypothetical protein